MLASLIGCTRQKIIGYEAARAPPEAARLRALAEAVAVDPAHLMGLDDHAGDLLTLRRRAGLTRQVAVHGLDVLLARDGIPGGVRRLTALENGAAPVVWQVQPGPVLDALAQLYQVPPAHIQTAWGLRDDADHEPAPGDPVQREVHRPLPLAGDEMDTWYARCPVCTLVMPPQSAEYAVTDSSAPDLRAPLDLRCGACGHRHTVTVAELQPQDATHLCPRST